MDYPKKDRMYVTCKRPSRRLYGNGFTIWKTLPDIEIERKLYFPFDLIIFGSIWRQHENFEKYCEGPPVLFLDGSDHQKIFEPALMYGKYFKRERVTDSVNPISFSIPRFKLRPDPIIKTGKIVNHATNNKPYIFKTEQDYYEDIAKHKYAITTKKGGWDCMRHYEIAANWTVPCFYRLDEKPELSAPFGLVDMENVISFRTERELQEKIEYVEDNHLYTMLQMNAYVWANENTCENVSKMVVS